jgi:hypothetical protein
MWSGPPFGRNQGAKPSRNSLHFGLVDPDDERPWAGIERCREMLSEFKVVSLLDEDFDDTNLAYDSNCDTDSETELDVLDEECPNFLQLIE